MIWPSTTEDDPPTATSYAQIVVGFLVVVFVMVDVVGLLWGSGLLSTIADARAAADQVPVIEVDERGLLDCFLAASGLVAGAGAALLRVDLSRRGTDAVLIGLVMGAGFLANAFIAPQCIDAYMASHGYTRCPSRDHTEEGLESQHIQFLGYVRDRSDCPGDIAPL